MKAKVIILGSHFNALSMVQIFGAKDIPVEVLADTKGYAGWSKYASWKKCPNPIHQPEGFKAFLTDYVQKQTVKPVVIPSMDQWALLLSECALNELNLAHAVVSDKKVLELLLNKDAFNQYSEEQGWSIPKSYKIAEASTISDTSFPVVAKPNFRMSPSKNESQADSERRFKLLNSYRLRRFDTSQELMRFIAQTPKDVLDNLILQEYISGLSDCMLTYGVYCKNGEVLGSFQGRKVRGYPYDYGDCIVGKEEPLPDDLIREANEVLKGLNYSGIAEVEYKLDAEKNTFHLIEINPRSWSWIGITQFTQWNLPWLAYCDAVGLPLAENEDAITNKPVYFIRKIHDRFNTSFRYAISFPKWSRTRKVWKDEFKAVFLYNVEASHKDYIQWMYTWCRENALLHINWWIRNK